MTISTVSGHVEGEEARFTRGDIRLIWIEFISGVFWPSGPFSRPRNSANLHNLANEACDLRRKVSRSSGLFGRKDRGDFTTIRHPSRH